MLNKTDLMKFLSIQAQDFIEEGLDTMTVKIVTEEFLSIQAQDFIEEGLDTMTVKIVTEEFLSIQAQDFIEEVCGRRIRGASSSNS